jgi:hypothetical protein
MELTFFSEPAPGDDLLARMAALAPANPFCTPAYLDARRAQGARAWVVGLRRGAEPAWACPAFLHGGGWSCQLEIESLPSDPDVTFWAGLGELCRRQRVEALEVWTLATPAAVLPALPGERWRKQRVEHVLNLRDRDLWEGLSTNQKRNVKRAHKAGVRLRCATDDRACRAHAELMALSLRRRKERGEAVAGCVRSEDHEPFLRCGAGELFQAVAGDTVLSSVLVLLAQRGGYYQSAGTSPEGMACGASPCLIHEIARELQGRSLEVFNLGGAAPDNPGLYRFKTELGAEQVPLECAGYRTWGGLRVACVAALRRLRDGLRRLWRRSAGKALCEEPV